jgi:macrodomain Ter protein organizer (MatP/YcbG family)
MYQKDKAMPFEVNEDNLPIVRNYIEKKLRKEAFYVKKEKSDWLTAEREWDTLIEDVNLENQQKAALVNVWVHKHLMTKQINNLYNSMRKQRSRVSNKAEGKRYKQIEVAENVAWKLKKVADSSDKTQREIIESAINKMFDNLPVDNL